MIEELLRHVSERPNRFASLRMELSRALGRKQNADLTEDFIAWYRTHIAPDVAADALRLRPAPPVDEFADVIETAPEATKPPRVAECLTAERPSCFDSIERRTPAVHAFSGHPGKYSFRLNYDIPVLLREGRLVQELSTRNWASIHLKGGALVYQDDPIEVGPLGLIVDDFCSHNNYCHWLLDWTPRFHLIEAAGGELAKLVYAFARPPARYMLETLNALGIGEHQILVIGSRDCRKPGAVATSRFLGGSTVYRFNHALHGGSPWARDFVRSRLLRRGGARSRLLVNRRDGRRLELSGEARAMLAKAGFREVRLEDMTVADQAALFNGAARIVAAHGAGLANLVFCEPGARLLEIFPPGYSTAAFHTVSETIGIEYSCAVGERVGEIDGRRLADYDIRCPDAVVRDWLAEASNQYASAPRTGRKSRRRSLWRFTKSDTR